ncbi:MAG: hypothetical protein JO294_00615 [Alphaproteobacteria bacterium]|nr:hypothetical protein [Alphaproteobacteria bacterium]
MIGVTGGMVPGRIVAINAVKLGDMNFNNTILVIADLDIFKAWGLNDEPAMFIGMNFLRLLSALTIDYTRKEIRFKLAETTRIARA